MRDFYQNLESAYDIAIVGSGPGGLLCAESLVKTIGKSQKIALLDKRQPWREPVLCAEAVSSNGLIAQTEVDEAWIRTIINGVDFVSPNGTLVKYQRLESGYILDRTLMHKNLAERCLDAGVTCNFKTSVKSISKLIDGRRNLEILENGEKKTISAKIVVDASGPGNALDTDEGLVGGKFDLETGVFAIVEGIEYDPNYIRMFYHGERFPEGYGWIFPRDEKICNVGLVVGRKFTKIKSPRNRLIEWIAEEWPNVKIEQIYGGAIPCGQPEGPMATNLLFKVGDAASTVNPMSRGGIVEAMKCGRAATRAICAILDGANHEKVYSDYTKDWMEIHGFGHIRLNKAKKIFGTIPDKVFDKAAYKLNKIPVEKRTLFRIFWATLSSVPILLWKMRSLLR